MAFIRTIPDDEASGQTKELYDADRKASGYVSNYLRLLGLRPEVYTAWRQLVPSVRRHIDERRYELVTLATASRLRCRY